MRVRSALDSIESMASDSSRSSIARASAHAREGVSPIADSDCVIRPFE